MYDHLEVVFKIKPPFNGGFIFFLETIITQKT